MTSAQYPGELAGPAPPCAAGHQATAPPPGWARRPIYSGSAPFGSCHLQCVANLLAWQQVADAAAALCPTWGFSWPGGRALHGSDRWVAAAQALHRIDISERHFPNFAAAHAAERESTAMGYPVAATVDAWYLPSPYQRNEHIAHCVIVTNSSAGDVWIIDPMNRPEPTRYSLREWEEMRSAACTGNLRSIFLTSGPRRRPTGTELVRFLGGDIRTHQSQDHQQCAAFLAPGGRTGSGPLDVSEVAAERLYLAKLVKRAARDAPGLACVADRLVSLSRRWYLAHSLGREAAGQDEVLERQVRLLRELADREATARRQFGTVFDALFAPAPREE
jgi:hypothetical protein